MKLTDEDGRRYEVLDIDAVSHAGREAEGGLIVRPLPDAPTRWRAKHGEDYFYLTSSHRIDTYEEEGDANDKSLYEVGNYFQTEAQAQAAAEALRACLAAVHDQSIDTDWTDLLVKTAAAHTAIYGEQSDV